MRLVEQRSIIVDFDSYILTMTSTAILIAKFNRSNYTQWSGEMVLLLRQKQVYGIVAGKDGWPEALAEQDATTVETLVHQTAFKDWVNNEVLCN
jgi:hypothetical protein